MKRQCQMPNYLNVSVISANTVVATSSKHLNSRRCFRENHTHGIFSVYRVPYFCFDRKKAPETQKYQFLLQFLIRKCHIYVFLITKIKKTTADASGHAD
jgi:hypothetical protein